MKKFHTVLVSFFPRECQGITAGIGSSSSALSLSPSLLSRVADCLCWAGSRPAVRNIRISGSLSYLCIMMMMAGISRR